MDNYNIREMMRINAHEIVREMVLEEVPFKLVIWNNDDWSIPLPESIMNDYPTQLIMDINEVALEHCYTDDAGDVVLQMMFGEEDEVFVKVLSYDEIVAVIDINTSQAYIVNAFKQDADPLGDEENQNTIRLTRDGLIRQLTEVDGLQKKDAVRSIDAILKHNPQYSYLLSK